MMKQIIVVLAIFALSLVAVNCQAPFTFATFNDSACGNGIAISFEASGTCILVGGGASLNITLNGTTGTIFQYSSAGCTGVSTSNTTFTVGACTNLTGAGSFRVSTSNTQIWSFTQSYQASTCTAAANLVTQSSMAVSNRTGSACTFSSCSTVGPLSFSTSCFFSLQSCDTNLFGVAGTYNQAGCAATALTSQSCIKPNTCINQPNNQSSQLNCAGGQATGGGSYNRPNCGSGGGNITVGNYTAGCANNGQGFYLTFSCVQPSSTTGASTTGGSTTGSGATLISFSIAILGMIILSLIF